MPPWIILDDFEDVPDAKSPFSTRAVFRPRLAASRATPAPVIPPPTTSTSNSRRRGVATHRRGERGAPMQACHILRGARPGHLSCHRGSRRGAAPSDGAGASRGDAPRPASCRGGGPGPAPGERWRTSRRRRRLEQCGPELVDGAGAVPASATTPRWRPGAAAYFCCAFSPFGVSRTTLPRRAVVSGSMTTQPRRSSHPVHMALASRDTPVSRGRSPTRVPERSSTRRVLALMGREIRAVDSKSTVKANSTPLRSGDREAIEDDGPDGSVGRATSTGLLQLAALGRMDDGEIGRRFDG